MNFVSPDAFLSLGSNRGDRKLHLKTALAKLNALEKTEIISVSNLYSTAAWGKEDQPDFLNMAVGIKTFFQPEILMKKIIRIEEEMGRVRMEKWGPRIIDIDILMFGNEKINSETITLPHPEMHKRKFVLVPMKDIAAEIIHPVYNKSIDRLAEECADPLEIFDEGKFIL